MQIKRQSLSDIPGDPVTEADFEEARSYVGERVKKVPYNECASRDTIYHFAIGLGDANPLWTDVEYGKNTQYGDILAPPSFILSVNNATTSKGLYRMLRLGSYWDVTWSEPIKRGDILTSASVITEPELLQRHRGGYVIKQNGETVYRNQTGTEVARALCGTFRVPKRGAGGVGYLPRMHEYSAVDIGRIEADILAEVVRGAEKRYVETVAAGDEMQPVVKGPLTEVDAACWSAGYNITTFGGPSLESRVRARHSEQTAIWGDQWDAHSDPQVARALGMPGVWMSGPAIFSWTCQLLTNWAGDDGFVEHLRVQVRKPSVKGDTIWFRGKIARVEGESVVCSLSAKNQIGEQVVIGEGTIILPQRSRLE